MREHYKSIVHNANEKKKAVETGGFDIMKKLVQKLRTTKPKSRKKEYETGGFDIMKKVYKHPVPIKKEKKKSLMEPIEVNPPKPVNNRGKF